MNDLTLFFRKKKTFIGFATMKKLGVQPTLHTKI